MPIKLAFRFILKFLGVIVLTMLTIVAISYFNTTIYYFPEPKAFSGNNLYNPYENLPDSTYRANFHAHSIEWKGVTDGHNTEKDLYDEYTKRGYDIPAISNYHKISDYSKDFTDLYIPVYEHGYNVLKSHYLSINPDEVSFFDFPLFQSTSHQQKVIEKLRAKNAFIAMAHPKFGGGRSFKNMKYLVNYDFTEVLNHYRISDEYWDKALSAGRLTSVMGNDDTHDIVNEATFRMWNVIYSNERNVDTILSNMRKGINYAVSSKNQLWDNTLYSCKLDSNTIEICFENKADSVLFIGQNGVVKKTVRYSDEATYDFKTNDTYIRMVAYNKNSDLYTNPIVRYSDHIPFNYLVKPEVNSQKTTLFKIMVGVVVLLLLITIYKVIKK